MRYAAALLRKVVDCLAPSMTAMLVRGKEVDIYIGVGSLYQDISESLKSGHFSGHCPNNGVLIKWVMM